MENFTTFIHRRAVRHPERPALILPDYARLDDAAAGERLTFGALWTRVSGYARQLRAMGVAPGQRVLVLLPLSADLYAVALAVMSLGATVVLVDAGQPRKVFVQCLRAARAHVLVGTRPVLRYRFVAPFLWRIPLKVAVDRPGIGLRMLARDDGAAPVVPAEVTPEQGALVTFTSGSTGRPKGADRTQAILTAQHRALKDAFPPPDDEVAMTCFPVVALHNLCCGVPTVLPAVDLRDVASVRPARVLRQLEAEGVNTLTGGPAFLQALTDHARAQGQPVRAIRRLGIGGAPVGRMLCEAVREAFPNAEAVIIYGSTEAEPVASIDVDEVLRLHASGAAHGLGYPAGWVHASTQVRLIRPHAGPVTLSGAQPWAAWEVAPGDWGEVVVSGAHVNTAYVAAPEADRANKIHGPDGRIWHRMGDVARRDAAGRLWLGGRAARLVEQEGTVCYPLQVAALLEGAVPGLRRSALHAVDGRVLLWVETDAFDAAMEERLYAVLARHGVTVDRILPHPALPVDARHRAKVDYPALEALARARVT